MMKLKIQFVTVDSATPLERKVEGMTSGGMAQGIGLQLVPKTNMKSLARGWGSAVSLSGPPVRDKSWADAHDEGNTGRRGFRGGRPVIRVDANEGGDGGVGAG